MQVSIKIGKKRLMLRIYVTVTGAVGHLRNIY